MPTWNSDQYLKFFAERTQPAIDLAARVAIEAPASVIDLGCGPGNSTAVLARRWPRAALTGLDSSTAMLQKARTDFPQWDWVEGDISTWSARSRGGWDIIFANASLQWVPDHGRVFPELLAQTTRGGAFAAQLPANFDAPPHRLMRELASSSEWRGQFTSAPREWQVQRPEFYYDVLASHAVRIDIWLTDYIHLLDSIDGIVEWYQGTGLRPWLDSLTDDSSRAAFLAAFREGLRPHFPARPDGRILFPFRRLFVIAYR